MALIFRKTLKLELKPQLTQRHADAVSLCVEQPSDLREVAVEAAVVLIHGALHQEGVLGVKDAGDAFFRALHKHAGLLGLHVVPHPLVRLVPRVLEEEHTDICMSKGLSHLWNVSFQKILEIRLYTVY